jgi:CRP-like cAMP-binding protein
MLFSKSTRASNPGKFLSTIGNGKELVAFKKRKVIFMQGDVADAIFYIQKGTVRLAVLSQNGKEATLSISNEREFFGEGSLAGQFLRVCSATAITDCNVLRIDKTTMMLALREHQNLTELFVSHLLARNIRYEEDLVDQLSNFSEQRLARILILLADFGDDKVCEAVRPKISQETLAEMIGTTRSRVSFFMNKFRKLGFVDYDGNGMTIRSSLLSLVPMSPPPLGHPPRDINHTAVSQACPH